MNIDILNTRLFEFLHRSPTPYHAVDNVVRQLEQNNFIRLEEKEAWHIKKDQGYFVVRNQSALITFYTGDNRPWETGMRMCGAHTDSPALKVKPSPVLNGDAGTRLGVEVYGGALLNSWFDRGLNLAGRLVARGRNPAGKECLLPLLINFDAPVAVIPSLPIHLDREANTRRPINAQVDLPPLAGTGETWDREAFLSRLKEMTKALLPAGHELLEIPGADLFCSDAQPPFFTGLSQEMISAPRLDNLLSCHVAASSIALARGSAPCLAILADHEEIGSTTAGGARGSFLTDVLTRLIPHMEQRMRALSRSFMISLDNAHALHPGHGEKYDPGHTPFLNKGPVLKINGAMRYATDAISSALFNQLCRQADVPMQTFVMRSDMPCGSTIGPSISAGTGVVTVDVGAPTMAMHAIRELTGKTDPHALFKVMKGFFTMDAPPLLSLT